MSNVSVDRFYHTSSLNVGSEILYFSFFCPLSSRSPDMCLHFHIRFELLRSVARVTYSAAEIRFLHDCGLIAASLTVPDLN